MMRADTIRGAIAGVPRPGRIPRDRIALVFFFAILLSSLLFNPLPAAAAERLTIDYEYVVGRAEEMAKNPYDPNWGAVPDFLKALSYDAFQDIKFNTLKSLWSDEPLPFRIEFIHPGGLYDRTVRINEFTATHVQEIRFARDFFDYGAHHAIGDKVTADLGYAGFRAMYPINQSEVFEGFAVFLGASYFRVIGRNQKYGLSARGLALQTTIGQSEEFPLFREYWLGKPAEGDNVLKVLALLDGPSVTGAYQFLLRPDKDTIVNVRATLFFRKAVEQMGLTPFSSMFLFGENSLRRPRPDYRTEVHDSDGLLIKTPDGGFLWRPLINPSTGREVSRWHFDAPVEFGLMQRDRDFENYQDIGAAYHLRPSVWVKPDGTGSGHVTLYEFATDTEAVDNIVVFWEPDSLPTLLKPYAFDYALRFTSDESTTGGHVIATRTGRSLNHPDLFECVVDFAGEELAGLEEVDPVAPEIQTGMGDNIKNIILRKNPYNEDWRLILQFLPPGADAPRDLHAYLHREGQPISETWIYRWTDLPK